MVMNQKQNKAQGLPLNTIVIALLVIIALVLIITFFVSKMNKSGGDFNNVREGSLSCEPGSTAISEEYARTIGVDTKEECDAVNGDIFLSVEGKDNKKLCCAIK
ncbi:hypothetical protein H6501_03970 [Candidatus Woesearchaeota archaeon]|nr:hypothetical protein [Candidatus Woesearchaeota archaeon]USN43805.1 MAG: hypothetical protein H6500_05445 [Candidatus Woesearchaeota archaeon]